MIGIALSLFAFTFGVVLIGLLALIKRKDKISILFAVFSFFVAGWGIPETGWMSQLVSLEAANILMRICNHSAFFIPVTWFAFIYALLNKKEPLPGFYVMNIVLAVCVTFTAGTDLFVKDPEPFGVYRYYPRPGPLFAVFTFIFFTYVPYVFFQLIKEIRQSRGSRKHQLLFVFWATLLGFGGGGCTFFPVYHIDISLAPMYFMPFYPLFMGIALMKYGLFDPKEMLDAFQRDKLASVGALSASINHEIRNPLYVIKSTAESLLAGEAENLYQNQDELLKASRETLQKNMEQADRALAIVKNFSNFAKRGMERVKQDERLSVYEVICGIQPLISHEIVTDHIDFKNNILRDSAWVRANKHSLEEIFINLIMNSCQAMKTTGGEIVISAEESGGKVMLEIRDNGPGIPKEQQKQIFEPFYTTKDEGTGLGLYITKQLVEKNGGRITVESESGRGTIFKLEFKAA